MNLILFVDAIFNMSIGILFGSAILIMSGGASFIEFCETLYQ